MNEDIKKLRDKYSKKCKSLVLANKKIKDLKLSNERESMRQHIIFLEWLALRQMTRHLEINKYRVKFKESDSPMIYTEENVFSFNKRLIKTALCKAIAKRTGSIFYDYNVEILEIEECK